MAPRKKAPVKKVIPQEIQNEKEFMIRNGLSEAILGFNPGGMGVQLSQVDTLFKNNRWYLVSNMRQLLSEIYVEHGLVQTVIDVPVDDALRGGIEVKSKQLDPLQIEDLRVFMEEKEDLTIAGQALKWNRLFGGAGILVITDQDPKLPLNIEAIRENSPLEFRDVDMWELFFSHQNTGDYARAIDQSDLHTEFYDYYGQKVQHTRVMKMTGLRAPSFIRPRLRGWGFSTMEALVRSINQYLKANDLTFEVLDEFKVDYYKIKNLSNTLLSANGTAKIQERIQLANKQKNYQRAVVMDSEDDFTQKQLSFTGLSEAQIGIRLQVASDLRMPLSKIFGIASVGFSSGEDDIENYNGMVESQVRQKGKFDILRLVKIRCQQLFQFVPDDLSINFKPLRILSAEQEETVKTQKFARNMQCLTIGAMSTKEFKEACNKDQLTGVQLDTSVEELTPIQAPEGSESEAPKGKESATKPKEAKS